MHTFFIVPTHYGVGLSSVAMGLFRALDRLGCRVGFFRPVDQVSKRRIEPKQFSKIMKIVTGETPTYKPISLDRVASLLAKNKRDEFMEEVVAEFAKVKKSADVIIVEGMIPTRTEPYARKLNAELAKTLSARTILVSGCDNGYSLSDIAKEFEIAAESFGGIDSTNIEGYILNQLNMDDYLILTADVAKPKKLPDLESRQVAPLGYIPWYEELSAARTCDYARMLNAEIIFPGAMKSLRVTSRILCARTAAHITDLLKPGTLVITPGDRDDIILAVCMACKNGVSLAGLLITGGYKIASGILDLCRPTIEAVGLPILTTKKGSYEMVVSIDRMDKTVSSDDRERIEMVVDKIAEHINVDWFKYQMAQQQIVQRLSPPAFRYQLVCRARQNKKRIVLPEGEEPRTVKAAIICQIKEIAHCVLLGKRHVIEMIAKNQDMTLPRDLEIIDPDAIRAQYVAPIVQLRKHKGLSEPIAEAMLEDNIVLGTMMLAEQQVDGLVSGAISTTANTIRPAFQLIKAKSKSGVSSVFFMLMPEQVLVYGDCAVNPDPTAEKLADIAIQSADSALAFGIEPIVAMISYSTGDSGQGEDVEKVREATRIAKVARPNFLIDGPLQYDAASVASVARSKAPNSPVAGRATVFVFPDLNTGNTTYKAVQRSANVVSVGPMLQGLNRPVNDLSRGALVDDIVYTIALTAIQAQF